MGLFGSDTDKIRKIAQRILDENGGRGVTPTMALAMAELEVYGPSQYEKKATDASVILRKYGWATRAGKTT